MPKQKKYKDCLDSRILKVYTTGLTNELVKCINKVRRKIFSDILYPKILIKLKIIVGSQELEVEADTNNNAFVRRGFCKALFW